MLLSSFDSSDGGRSEDDGSVFFSSFLFCVCGGGKGNFVGCFRSDGCVSVGDCFGCHGDEGGGGNVVSGSIDEVGVGI